MQTSGIYPVLTHSLEERPLCSYSSFPGSQYVRKESSFFLCLNYFSLRTFGEGSCQSYFSKSFYPFLLASFCSPLLLFIFQRSLIAVGGTSSICQKYCLPPKAHKVLTRLQILVFVTVYMCSLIRVCLTPRISCDHHVWCFIVFHSSGRGVHLKHVSSSGFWLLQSYWVNTC